MTYFTEDGVTRYLCFCSIQLIPSDCTQALASDCSRKNKKNILIDGENNCLYSSNPRRVGLYNSYTWASRWASIHMSSIYTNTPPQSELPTQRCSRLDNKKANTPPQSELPTQQCSRQDKKRVQRANTPLPPAATTSHRLR